jgi:molybdopterin molybdotransferase
MRPTALHHLHAAIDAAIDPVIRVQRVPFLQALHRLAAEPVVLAADRPACARAVRAGWAVHPGAGPRRPAGTIAAAGALPPVLPPDGAFAVEAGAPVEPGWAVIDDHDTSAIAGTGIAAAGSIAAAGTTLIAAGDHLDPCRLGLAAWAGLEEIAVIAPARTVILVPEPLEGGDAAGATLLAWCLGWGLPASRHRLPGEPPLRLEVLGNAIDRARVMVVAADGAGLAAAIAGLGFQAVADLPAFPGCGIAVRHSGTILIDLPADPDLVIPAVHLLLWPVLARLGSLPPADWRPAPGSGATPVPWSGDGPMAGRWAAARGVAIDGGWLPWCHHHPGAA